MELLSILCRQWKHSLYMWKQCNGNILVVYYILQALGYTIPLMLLYVFRCLLDEVITTQILHNIVIWLIVYALLAIVDIFTSHVKGFLHDDIIDKINHYFDKIVSEKAYKLEIAFVDSAEGRNKIDEVRRTRYNICAYPFYWERILFHFISFAVASTVIAQYNIYAEIIFILLVIPGVIINNNSEKKIYAWNVKEAPDRRKFSYYRWMMTDSWPAKDVRMYDLGEDIQERYHEEKNAYIQRKKALSHKGMKSAILAKTLTELGVILYMLMVIWDVWNQRITVGDLVMLTGFGTTVVTSVSTVLGNIIHMATIASKQYVLFEEYMNLEEDKDRCSERKKQVEGNLESFMSIEFKKVFFRYPHCEEYALKNINFSLKRGERLALVGANGSGKTTIIKILLGLYKIEKGEILLNGRPLEQYDKEERNRLFSSLFQGYVCYPTTLRENIGLYRLEDMYDDDRMTECLEISGFHCGSEEFSEGLDTPLTHNFCQNGIELSKGQWQKIAIARAYFKNAEVIILDEPSSALDAKAEESVLNDFYAVTRDKTGIIVSHRLSCIKAAEKIIVLKEGFIEGKGTHEELMVNNETYRHLYQLQAEKYME